MHREGDNLGRGRRAENLLRGVHAVQHRHADVDHRDVRVQGSDLVHRFAAIRRLANHVEVLPLEQRPHALADELMVVGKHDPDCHDAAPSVSHGQGNGHAQLRASTGRRVDAECASE